MLEESVETRYCPLPPNQVPTTASAILSRGPAKGLPSYVTLRYQIHRKPPKLLHVGQLANSELILLLTTLPRLVVTTRKSGRDG